MMDYDKKMEGDKMMNYGKKKKMDYDYKETTTFGALEIGYHTTEHDHEDVREVKNDASTYPSYDATEELKDESGMIPTYVKIGGYYGEEGKKMGYKNKMDYKKKMDY